MLTKKSSALFSFLFVLLAFMMFSSIAAAATPKVTLIAVGEIVNVKGVVTAIDVDKKSRVLKEHSPVFPKDTLHTNDSGYASLRFTDGTLGVVQPNSKLEISSYSFSSKNSSNTSGDHFKIKLGEGGLILNTGKIARSNADAFQVSTPAGKIHIASKTADIAYMPKTGLAVKGTGTIVNAKGTQDIVDNVYSLLSNANALITTTQVAPAMMVSYAATSMVLMQESVAQYGESVAYEETATYEADASEEAIATDDSEEFNAADEGDVAADSNDNGNEAADSNEGDSSAADSGDSGGDDEDGDGGGDDGGGDGGE